VALVCPVIADVTDIVRSQPSLGGLDGIVRHHRVGAMAKGAGMSPGEVRDIEKPLELAAGRTGDIDRVADDALKIKCSP
jgi:hypothetical protein